MVAQWLSNAFRRFVSFFSGEESPNDAHHQEPQASPNSGAVSPRRGPAKSAEKGSTKELFDNEWRRKAQEHAESRAELFKQADEAREDGDHSAANEYVNKVSVFFIASGCHPGR